MAVQRVLIAVKTYPSISSKYGELVCTAGFLEDGRWIRTYPIKFRGLAYEQQYKKYDWIDIDIVRNTSDFRPESYRPVSEQVEPVFVGHLDTANEWQSRKAVALKNVYTDLEVLINDAKDKSKYVSLAVFKPTKILDFKIEEVGREWDQDKMQEMQQLNIFSTYKNRSEYVKKLPYKFSYTFEDEKGKQSTLMIEDWEIGALFWRYEDEELACQKVKEKYFDDLAKTKDIYFFLGTTLAHHNRSKNPFIIIGTFHPKFPKNSGSNQMSLFS